MVGAQVFTCRGARHTSAAGMVMAFNPDDPHDGSAASELSFTYRMIHIGPETLARALADGAGRPTSPGGSCATKMRASALPFRAVVKVRAGWLPGLSVF